MSTKIKQINTKGSAAVISLLVFLAISTSVMYGFSEPLVQGAYITGAAYESKASYYTAEALTEDVAYRLNKNLTLGGTETLNIGGSVATATITTNGSTRDISVIGGSGGFNRTIQANISVGAPVSFNYGVQAGTGGFDIGGGSRVVGSVYANGNITGSGGAVITGSAVAGDDIPLTLDQTNISPVTSTQSIVFGSASASQDFAQSFRVSSSSPINKIQLFIRKTGTPGSPTVRIVNDNSGSPGTTNLVTGTLTNSLVATSYGWIDVVFTTNPILNAGTTYWLVLDGTNNASRFYTVAANTAYANGTGKVGQYAGTWNNTPPTGLDGYFNIYLGGTASTLGGGSWSGSLVVGTVSTDVAWANTVRGLAVPASSIIYCIDGTNNSKACDVSKPNPSTKPSPVADAKIQEWKNSAAAGTNITGNVTVGWQGTTTGPLKINGNLTINGGGVFTATGPIWVTGTITITAGGSIVLSPTYGATSGTVIADGNITISGGGNINGSGVTGSYIMLLTTSSSVTAMTVTGGAGAVVLVAQNGTINFSGGTASRVAVAKRITLSGGTTITYDTGLQNPNFSGGTTGAWSINSWRETE